MSAFDEISLAVAPGFEVQVADLHYEPLRASGPGGQNVNKVSTAVQLRYDLAAADMPEPMRERLLAVRDRRLAGNGVLVIKAQRFRSQARNREDALRRLLQWLRAGAAPPRRRVPTRPGRAARERRLDAKGINSKTKRLRRKPELE